MSKPNPKLVLKTLKKSMSDADKMIREAESLCREAHTATTTGDLVIAVEGVKQVGKRVVKVLKDAETISQPEDIDHIAPDKKFKREVRRMKTDIGASVSLVMYSINEAEKSALRKLQIMELRKGGDK